MEFKNLCELTTNIDNCVERYLTIKLNVVIQLQFYCIVYLAESVPTRGIILVYYVVLVGIRLIRSQYLVTMISR